MDKQILLSNVSSLIKTGDKDYYRRIVKNFNLDIVENNILSIVSSNNEEKKIIGELIANNIKPTQGKVIYDGNYFLNKKNYRGDKVEFIRVSDLNEISKEKDIASFLTENITNKKFVTANYKAALTEVKSEIAKYSKQLDIYRSNKKYLHEKLLKKEEYYKDRITEVNPELKAEKQYREKIDMFKAVIEDNNQLLKQIPSLEESDILLEKKFHLGKEASFKENLKDVKEDLNRIKKLEKKELREIAQRKESERNIDKLIYSRSKRETNNLIKYIKGLNKPNLLFEKSFLNLMDKIQAENNQSVFYELLNDFLKEVKRISKFLNEEIQNQLLQRNDFIRNILDPKSPINSKYFNELLSIINERYDDKQKYFEKVISDIDKKLVLITQQDKQEKNPDMRELWEFEMISLRFQAQIYRERIAIINNQKPIIDQIALEHNTENTLEIYAVVKQLEKTLYRIDIALNRWRFRRKIKSIKMEYKIKAESIISETEKLSQEIVETEDKLRYKSLYEEMKDSYVQEFTNEFKLKIEAPTYEITKEEKLVIKNKIEELEEKIEELRDREEILLSKLDVQDTENKELEMTYLLDEISFDTDSLVTTIEETSLAQRQRLSLVKSVLEGKEVVIIENPSYDLDLNAKTEIGTAVKNISKKYGTIIILLTNDMRIASTVSDTVAFVNNGVIYEKGTSSEIFNNPLHPYTKSKIKEFGKTAVITQETSILNFRGETLNHNMFSNLENRSVNANHSIYCTEEEFAEWTQKVN